MSSVFTPKALQGLYFLCEPIAEGSFGHIFLAIHALTKQKVAIKILEKKRLGSDAFRVKGEIDALKKLSHPFIYSLYQVVETDSTFYLIVEYLSGGELFDYILQKGSLSELEARTIFRQLVSAIGYAHAKGIAHRDLKPENILLDEGQNIRVIDFGLCAKNGDIALLNTFCGSLAYAAPEVLANREYSGHAADIWSMGVILYTLLCGCLPFDPTKPERLPQIIAKGKYIIDEKLSSSSRHLLSRLLCVDPNERINMDELCQHSWLLEEGGGPVNLHLDLKAALQLNPEIVKEIALYTRIPRVEMMRMLRRRSYDYLMATYMIMEQLYSEADVFLRLQRRDQTQVNGFGSRQFVAMDLEGISGRSLQAAAPRSRPSRHHTTFGSHLLVHHQYQTGKENQFTAPLPPTSSGPQNVSSVVSNATSECSIEPLRPVKSYNSTKSTASQTSTQNINSGDTDSTSPVSTKCSKLSALSPGRSIDSQLNQITKELRIKDPKDLGRTPSVRFDISRNRSDDADSCSNEDFNSSDVRVFYDAYSPENEQSKSAASVGEINGSVDSAASTEVVSGWQSRHIFKQFARKTIFSGSGNGSSNANAASSSKLRKVKNANNVIWTNPDLSPSTILERLAEALTANSIPFTLKRHGFVCTFANDWGKTLLSFELEVVDISGRQQAPTTISKLQLPKKLGVGGGCKQPPLTPIFANRRNGCQVGAIAMSSSEKAGGSMGGGTVSSTTSSLASACSDSAPRQAGVGIKMKRIHGDAFAYTSICRTVLEHAQVKYTN